MKKIILLFFAVLVIVVCPYSQPITFIKTYDFGLTNHAMAIIQTPDNGYYMGGHQAVSITYNNFLSVKADSLGVELWAIIEDLFSGSSEISDVALSGDGGYLSVGVAYNDESNSGDVLLVKSDAGGNILLTKFYGYPEVLDQAVSIEPVSDKGYIICGVTVPMLFQPSDIYVLKIDSLFNEEWSRKIQLDYSNVAKVAIEAKDGGYLVAGVTEHINGYQAPFLWKLDLQGDSVWFKTYGDPLKSHQFLDIIQLENGNIILGGIQSQEIFYDAYFVLTDEEGNLLNEKHYGDSWDQGCQELVYDPERQLFICIEDDHHEPGIKNNIALLAVDENLDSLWKRSYQFDPPVTLYAYAICGSQDGGYAFTGITGEGACPGCIVLFKTDSLGCIEPGCTETPVVNPPMNPSALFISPNPASESITIFFDTMLSQPMKIALFDMSGRKLKEDILTAVSGINNERNWDISSLPVGQYMIELIYEGTVLGWGRFMKS